MELHSDAFLPVQPLTVQWYEACVIPLHGNNVVNGADMLLQHLKVIIITSATQHMTSLITTNADRSYNDLSLRLHGDCLQIYNHDLLKRKLELHPFVLGPPTSCKTTSKLMRQLARGLHLHCHAHLPRVPRQISLAIKSISRAHARLNLSI